MTSTETVQASRAGGPVDPAAGSASGAAPAVAGSSPAPGVATPPRTTLDRIVAVLPAACAVHCILTPFLAAAVPFVALGPTGEWMAFSASTLLAGLAVRTTTRVHGRRVVWVPVVLGAAVWLASLVGLLQLAGEWEWSAGIGGLVLASGVIWSSRLRHRSVCGHGSCVV